MPWNHTESDKISVVTFAAVHESAAAAGQKALALAEHLWREHRLHRLVCRGFNERGLSLPAEFTEVPGRQGVHRVARRILPVVSRWTGGSTRRYQEQMFDFFTSQSQTLLESAAVVFLKPGFPLTARALKNNKRTTVALASILAPRFNCERVEQEAARLKIADQSSHTDLKRVADLDRFFLNVDWLLVSSTLAENSFAESGISRTRIRRLEDFYAVDCERFQPGPSRSNTGSLRVLHLSHMSLIKGVEYLVRAWHELNLPAAELQLAGSGVEKTGINSVQQELASIKLTGLVEDAVPLYQAADLFVSCSVADCVPNTLLEAMACGTPVLCSDACGASEIIEHGVDGFVYSYNSLSELKELLRWCHTHRDRLASIGAAARRKALRYQPEAMSDKLVSSVDICLHDTRNLV